MSAVTPVATRTSPYQGLTAYTARDRSFFFGREHETRIIVANLLATRLTLVYGASGVGKSSLMCAGVVPRLRELAQEGIAAGRGPGCVVAVFPAEANEDDVRRASWQDDPIEGIALAIEDAVAALGLDVDPPRRTGNLTQLLDAWTERLEADVLLVLDQFEEYFVYHGDKDGDGTLAVELPRALSEATLAANVVISIREDAYTRLDRFKGRLPILYDNYLRIDHLSREGAREAIVRPLEEYRKLHPGDAEHMTIEPELVEEVLEQVQSGAVALGQAGRGSVGGGSGGAGIETPFLQLVMERLWSAERQAGSQVLRLQTLRRLGGARPIVRAHLDDAMATLEPDDQDICARVFGRLVTPSRTKIAYLAADLAEQEGLDPERLAPVLEDLAAKRILRPVAPPPDELLPRYEIFHDVLAPAVLDWRGRWAQTQEHLEAERTLKADLERQEHERHAALAQAERERRLARRRRRVAVAAMVFAVLAAGLAAYAIVARQQAVDAQDRARVNLRGAIDARGRARDNELLTQAISAPATDPANALAAAVKAVSAVHGTASPLAVKALREAVRTSALMAVVHRGRPVADAGFSADAARFFTVAGDRLDLWDGRTGRHLAGVVAPRSRGMRAELLDAAFSLDGATLAVGGDRGAVWLWHPPAGRLEALGHGRRDSRHPVLHVAMSPHGHRVLAMTDDGVRIWSLSAPHAPPMTLAHRSTPTAASFSPNGRRVLTAGLDGRATIWDARTGRRLRRLGHDKSRALRTAQFGPGGRLVVTGSDATDAHGFPIDGLARVWDAATGRGGAYVHTATAITSVAFDHRGSRVVVGTADGSALIWRASRKPAPARAPLFLRGHTDQVASVAFSPDNDWVLTASSDETARLWDAATGTLLAPLRGHHGPLATAAFSRSGNRILTAGEDGTARLWRLPVVRPEVTLGPGIAAGTRVNFDQDGAHAVLVARDRSARVYDAHTGRLRGAFDHEVWFAALSPDGTRVLTLSFTHIAAWDAKSGRLLASKQLYAWLPPSMSADRRWTAVVAGNRVFMWNTQTGRLSRPLPQPRDAATITATVLSGDGGYAAAARTNGTVTIWDTTTRRVIRTIRKAKLASLALSPDGSELVGSRGAPRDFGGRHREVPWLMRSGVATTAWSTATGRRLFVVRSRDTVTMQRFSPDGRLVVTAGNENVARVWDARTGRLRTVLRGHTGPLTALRFDAKGNRIVTASTDGTARVWNAGTGELLAELAQGAPGGAWTAAFSPSGAIVVGSPGRVGIYGCRACGTAADLLAQAPQLEPRDYR
jgi:WD40 repeat protein